eukprot:TRINITY_DN67429_c2_g1_i1.p1 TRINITY_DN67429_c2_g1~~TRINITY_DN67429_c2_g1_i1.p1  ORF type:complete len:347 (+),score=33.94 TRINITY_DN67429_c2_g1_i1:121-1041(+)
MKKKKTPSRPSSVATSPIVCTTSSVTSLAGAVAPPGGPTITMADGRAMPVLGLGVFSSAPGPETQNAVLYALKAGYRHIDTAALYKNEADVGAALAASGIARDQVFITTKIRNNDQGYNKTLKAARKSLEKLGLQYIDLLLLHAPVPKKRLGSWRALEELKAAGVCKSIGVSNYAVTHLQELFANCKEKPVVNQIELSPYLNRSELADFCTKHEIVVQAYSPLTRGEKLKDPKLVAVANSYERSTAQVLIKWAMQKGWVVLPKSVTPERIVANFQMHDFTISDDHMAEMETWDEGLVTVWNPLTWK